MQFSPHSEGHLVHTTCQTTLATSSNILEQVLYPSDLKDLSIVELKQLANEVRHQIIATVAKTGGHLGAGLGVVELTLALHHVFDTPHDYIVWDVGHQTYPHKLLTGRKHLLHTLRQSGGLAGFPKRCESVYDVFGVGHSSTSISAALGMALARDMKGEERNIIAVIGDGAISAGMAYEAMNNAGHLRNRLIVILNDNKMSIAPAVGAMSGYLCRLMSSQPYISIRSLAKGLVHHMPQPLEQFAKKTKKYLKDCANGGNFFEEMGFHYVGPVDGHDLEQLVPILNNIKTTHGIDSPILLHVKTQKGKGFESPEISSECYHAVNKFDLETKVQHKPKSSAPAYTKIFAETLIDIAQQDKLVVAITAAMPSGTGLNLFANHFPDRTYDVGIAEQHAVTFAAGLAVEGIKPFVAIYSTFLQRAYDQVVHDVAIQKLPVRFIVDRAGLVGADGPTHAGSFDVMYLANLPNFVVMAPADELELKRMILTAYHINDRPSAVRFPRGDGIGISMPANLEPLAIGRGRIICQGRTDGMRIAILSLGTRLQVVQEAAAALATEGIYITIADARFAKPLDEALLKELVCNHEALITIEEGSTGGFGALVAHTLAQDGAFDRGLYFRTMCLPDRFLDHGTMDQMYAEAGLDMHSVVAMVKQIIAASKAVHISK